MSQGQILELEGRIDDLGAQVKSLLQREAYRGKHRQTRLGQTVDVADSSSSSAGAYPTHILEIVSLDCSSPGAPSSSSSSSSSTAAIETDAYPFVFIDGDSEDVPGRQSVTALPRILEENAKVGHAIDPMTCVPQGDLIKVLWHNGKWWVEHRETLVGIMLAEQHPGRFTHFQVYLGTWNPATTQWEFNDLSTTYTAMDSRYDVSYPAAGSTGLAEWRPWTNGS